MTETDILIAGAGPAGLAAACALGAEGHRVTLVDPAPPVTGEDAPGADLRTTALLQPARDLLDRAGVWEALAPHGSELWTMRIVDASRRPHVTRDFDAMDISDAPFGWNFQNWLLRRELLARVEALGIDTRFGQSVDRLFTRETEARVTLSDGSRIAARLVLACDGKHSPVRAMAGIGARTVDYGQTAIVFAVAHDAPHGDVSTEIHRAGGPFTLVPLADRDGAHRSAVVWMDRAAEQARRMELPEDIFAAEANERAAGVMGELRLVSPRAAWPILSRLAHRMTARRVALAAEAAHAMPPIGAQGLNTSLADIATLRDLAAGTDPGSARVLDRYQRRRYPEVAARMAGIDLLNRTSIAGASPVQAARAWGVGALHDLGPVRKTLMKLGMGSARPA
ncbi:FAD-dependent monooxygenase [Jannaschia ovalis]|uniref:FAD-dependent monooxygenase n=1 Tax=Jannaschia ovalis TaxID=3038773 RepID=A0ABY8LEK3_9RHOB|nr:FAD-dependent monooxygenase [Jannaschia sp. GRR-S6-38]WGH79067.1 FAD-dependent monooxygenase [Jannaschia sp. GRR-S6-38]